MWIGVLADTRGALHPRTAQVFDGMDYILHCGKIGTLAVLEELSHVSPINGVLGEGDSPEEFPFESILLRSEWGLPLLVTHKAGSPARPDPRIKALIEEHGAKVLLFGDGDAPVNATVDKCLWLNPGSASVEAGSGPATVGILEIEGTTARAEIVEL